MNALRFIVIGSGWRSLFYARIAAAYPQHFQLLGMLCRGEEKAERMRREYGIPAMVSEEELDRLRPDFVVVAVNKASISQVSAHWAMKEYPVLCETPAALTMEELNHIWELHTAQGCRIQVAEQYLRYPVHAAGIQIMERGLLGSLNAMDLSAVHDYHGVSLMRHYLGTGLEPVKIWGKRYTYPVMETDSRDGAITDGSVKERDRARLTFEFEGGKTAFYDFSNVQYHSYIRSRRLQVQGVRGELNNQVVRFVGEDNLPVEAELELQRTMDGNGIDRITLDRELLYQNPLGSQVGLPEDETAIASMMLDMRQFIQDGTEVYPLREALQDSYLRILMKEALDHPGMVVESREQKWNS